MYEIEHVQGEGCCPYCGNPATLTTCRGRSGVVTWSSLCAPCARRSRHRKARCAAVLTIIERQIAPALRNVLRRGACDLDRGPDDLATATDADLLSMRGFGQGYLAAFRAAWPRPAPIDDPWREHAEMVAGAR